jgi:hypothetical protein
MATIIEISERPSLVEVETAGSGLVVEIERSSVIEVELETRVQVIELEAEIVETFLETAPTEITISSPRPSIVELVEIQGYAISGGSSPSVEVEAVDFSARDSIFRDLVYFAWSSAAEGSENQAAAEWKIARFDSTAPTVVLLYAGGSLAYNKVLDSGSLDYEGYSYV